MADRIDTSRPGKDGPGTKTRAVHAHCLWCGADMPPYKGRGAPAKFCRPSHSNRWSEWTCGYRLDKKGRRVPPPTPPVLLHDQPESR